MTTPPRTNPTTSQSRPTRCSLRGMSGSLGIEDDAGDALDQILGASDDPSGVS